MEAEISIKREYIEEDDEVEMPLSAILDVTIKEENPSDDEYECASYPDAEIVPSGFDDEHRAYCTISKESFQEIDIENAARIAVKTRPVATTAAERKAETECIKKHLNKTEMLKRWSTKINSILSFANKRKVEPANPTDIFNIKATDMELFKCEQCNRAFFSMGALSRHRLKHGPDSTFKCDFCGRVIREKCNLRHHIQVHLGKERYRCKQCGRAYMHLNSLRAHLQPLKDGKLFQCCYCYRSFYARCTLAQHIKTHVDVTKNHECRKCLCTPDKKATMKHKSCLHRHYKCENCQ